MDTHQHHRRESRISLRNTAQPLAPVSIQPTTSEVYDVYPTFPIEDGEIFAGFDTLADWICQKKNVVIDGYVGVFWDIVREKLTAKLKKHGKSFVWREVQTAMLDERNLDKLVEPFLNGDDPVFGKRCDKELSDFFVREKLEKLVPDSGFEVNILAGPGAALANWKGALVYIDLPKNELQYRMRAKSLCNLGTSGPGDSAQTYKRFYFVDWVILNSHKKKLLPALDVIVDGQRPDEITWMAGQAFRSGLQKMSTSAFRVRPWFEPGVWGGTWIKKNIPGSAKDVVNYAWSFELIVPENGLIFQKDGRMLEASFDFLMYADNEAILGEAAGRFGDEFPIRFDFLDTFDGGNLSIQCHPRPEYIKEVFGENFTQDESYYILDTKKGARVYLGFQESIDPAQWRNELVKSLANGTPVEIDDYVQSHPAHTHDLFLIPNGTIHGSGVNNLVLEISSTPYIYTFKMYDWLRMDLDGKPRPINIEHAFNNLCFDRKGKKVGEELIVKPILIEEGVDWKLYHLKTHPLQFYDVHRYEFQSELSIQTEHRCLVMSLVEGSSVVVQTENGMRRRFNYAETFIVPAAAKSFRIENEGRSPAKLLKVFVKSDACSNS
jgi:mannose-6-phosphate isomerase class I